MSVNPLHCILSYWQGNDDNCRWCNSDLEGPQKRWCSGTCLNTWRLHHRYFLSRQIAVKAAKRKCSCIRKDNEPRHIHCAHCGLCEAIVKLRGGEMSCDHIIPRRGDRSRFSCNHHPDNLQMLCDFCHTKKSAEDELQYGIKSFH